jgi:hypothetical protein
VSATDHTRAPARPLAAHSVCEAGSHQWLRPRMLPSTQSACEHFAALQAAYDSYETERPRNFKRRAKVGDDENPLRQLFGVGCSWTDNEHEIFERLSIHEQASHGLTYRACVSGSKGYLSVLPDEGESGLPRLRTAESRTADGGDTRS